MIIAMGVPGAGKTSVLKGLELGEYRLINYGDLMFEIARDKYKLANRDEIRKLGVGEQAEVQRAVAEKLAAMKERIILDTHCSINTPNGYLPGLPFSLLSKLKVEKLVYVTAPPEEILGRRERDNRLAASAGGRIREVSLEQLKEHEEVNRAFLAAYAAFSGAPASIIQNRDNGLGEAVAGLQKLIR